MVVSDLNSGVELEAIAYVAMCTFNSILITMIMTYLDRFIRMASHFAHIAFVERKEPDCKFRVH